MGFCFFADLGYHFLEAVTTLLEGFIFGFEMGCAGWLGMMRLFCAYEIGEENECDDTCAG